MKAKTLTEFFEESLKDNLQELLKTWVFDGFQTYEDYVKYGEMFLYAEPRKVEYTPYTRQLTQGTIKP